MRELGIIEPRLRVLDTAGVPRGTPRPVNNTLRECLTFRLGAEEYGIDILRVQEIRGYEAPTRIANALAFVKGVLNLRGTIVPVVDLRLKFGLEEVVYDAVTVTVVLNVAGRTVGAVVDAVSDVVALTGDQVMPAPEFNAVVGSSHVVGIGAIRQGDRERMLILLDIEALMSSAEMGLVNAVLH
ncbi:MAG: chemotaxis protein CheW [Burkholderiaceae bacterium]|nr:chemotaxis protein CheW [Burkholderiaceae bacterium]